MSASQVQVDAVSPVIQEAKNKLVRIMISQVTNITANSPPVQEACVATLHKLCDNVLSNPSEEKFRKVRANNAMMKRKVSACRGGVEFLLASGWTREVENFEPYFVFKAGGGVGDAALLEILHVAEEVLRKQLALVTEKRERYERQRDLEKNDAANRKKETMQAIEEDKELRKAKHAQ